MTSRRSRLVAHPKQGLVNVVVYSFIWQEIQFSHLQDILAFFRNIASLPRGLRKYLEIMAKSNICCVKYQYFKTKPSVKLHLFQQFLS